MSKEFVLPAPVPVFDLDDMVFDRVSHLMRTRNVNILSAKAATLSREDFKRVEVLGRYRSRRLFSLISPFVTRCAEVLGSNIIEHLAVDTRDVAQNETQRSPKWHPDAAAISLAGSDALTTNFVTGVIDETHPIATMLKRTPKAVEPPEEFSESVDKAIDKGELSLYQTDPGVVYAFTYAHIHCSQVNETQKTVSRCFMRALSGIYHY